MATLDPALGVARHEIGRRNIDLAVFLLAEHIDARVLQIAPDDTADGDVFAWPCIAGFEATDAADDQIDFYAGMGGGNQRI